MRLSFSRALLAFICQALVLAFLVLFGALHLATALAYLVLGLAVLLISALLGLERSGRANGQAQYRLQADLQRQSGELAVQGGRLAALLHNLDSGVVLVNADGDVLLKNDALDEIFALSPQERTAGSLSHLLRHYQFVDLWRAAARRGAPQSLMAEVPQSRRFVRASVVPLAKPLQGQALLLFQDVSELHRLETVRKDFVSNVSHELRTPLTSLKVLTESLSGGALEEPETAKRFLDHIETEVDALTELVAELLELARIESQRAPLQLEAGDACQILHRAAERLRVQAERAELEMTIECEQDLEPVWADPPRLEQVLVNLIHNAVKFTPHGGHIRLAVGRAEGGIRFSVADDGVGIAEDVLPRVFERFYKTDRARNQGGTGLGLSISKHIVEAHGGRIWVGSQEGQGSTFNFVIPTQAGDMDAAAR